jgi:hypothetical protein
VKRAVKSEYKQQKLELRVFDFAQQEANGMCAGVPFGRVLVAVELNRPTGNWAGETNRIRPQPGRIAME